MEQGFKLGKAYQHHSGSQLYICGMMDGILHGKCFIGENGHNRELLQISQHKWDHYVPKKGEVKGPRPGSSGRALSVPEVVVKAYMHCENTEYPKRNSLK